MTTNVKDITRGSLTSEQVREHEDALARHYGEPVRPVSHYCKAFREWAGALHENHASEGSQRDENLARIAQSTFGLELAITKSNLLYRLIYLGQPLRTRKCPEHDGRWSGYAWPGDECPHGCCVGYDITGWLP